MGSVNSIETLGAVDGPGLRTVVFLNGCALRCKYCHNPEMHQILDDNMDEKELADKIIRNKPYFKNGGGVTFSGGEPLLQSDYLTKVAKILKEEDIHIALDTSGNGIINSELLELTDLVILDIKDARDEYFKELTGQENKQIKDFTKYLKEINKPLWIRHVIVPGFHDTIEYVNILNEYITNYFNKENILKIEFLPYHKLGSEKYISLNIPNPFLNKPAMGEKICQELFNEFMKIYQSK